LKLYLRKILLKCTNQVYKEAQNTAEQVKSSIVANVKIDENKLGVVVKEAKNSSSVIQSGAKANIIISKTKQAEHLVAKGSVATSNVLSKDWRIMLKVTVL